MNIKQSIIAPLVKHLFVLLLFTTFYSQLFAQLNKGNQLIIGRLELSEGNYKTAIEHFNYVIKNGLPNYEPYYLRGISKYSLGDIIGAESDLTKAIELRPLFIKTYIIRGSIRDRLNNFDGAFADYNKALTIDSTNSGIYLNRAVSYVSLQQYQNALNDCNKAFKYHSKKELTYIIRGMAKMGLKNYKQAISDFSIIIKNNPYNASNALVRRGSAYFQLEKLDSALSDIHQAINLDSTNSYAYFQRAIIYKKQEKTEAALRDINMVISLSPNATSAYYNKALLLTDKEDLEGALKNYNKVILLNPKNILAYYNRAILLLELKKYRAAKVDIEKAIEIYPDFTDGYRLRASLKREKGDYKGAEMDMQTAKVINESKLNITDSLKHFEELNLMKLTAFSGGNSQNTSISNKEIALYPMYYISLISTHKKEYIIDDFNRKNKTYTAYQLINEEVEVIDIKRSNNKLKILNNKILNNTTNAENYLKRALIYSSSNKKDLAILDFNKSISLDPNNHLAYFSKANMLLSSVSGLIKDEKLNENGYQLVMKDYNKSIELNNKFAYAYFNRANLKCKTEDYIGAIEDYSEAIKNAPKFAEAHINRALILLIINNNEQACKDLSTAGELGFENVYSIIKKYCSQ